MNALLQGLPLLVTAAATLLGRAAWIDSHDRPTGAFSLVGDLRDEDAPRSIVNGPAHAAALGTSWPHPAHWSKILDHNYIVLGDEPLREAVEKVRPSTCYALVLASEEHNGLAATAASLLSARHATLRATQALCCARQELGRRRRFPVARRYKRKETEIYADDGSRRLQRLGSDATDDNRMPAVRLADDVGHPDVLFVCGKFPPRPPCNPQSGEAERFGRCPNGIRFKRPEPIAVSESRIAWNFTSFDAPEESLEGAVQPRKHEF